MYWNNTVKYSKFKIHFALGCKSLGHRSHVFKNVRNSRTAYFALIMARPWTQIRRILLEVVQSVLVTGRLYCINPLNAELNPVCYLLALLGAHHFLHVSRIRVKSLTFRLLMSYIYIYIYIYDISSLRVNDWTGKTLHLVTYTEIRVGKSAVTISCLGLCNINAVNLAVIKGKIQTRYLASTSHSRFHWYHLLCVGIYGLRSGICP